MAATNSVHGQLEKVRKPRVHISYDVETEGAEVKKELPFVVGVMGDLSGHSTEGSKPLKERKFVQIDADNFNQVMTKMQPGLSYKVPNTLKDDDSEIAVDLNFRSMDDFEPAKIANQVEPLRKLIEVRNQLSDLLSKADRSDKLESMLENILQNADDLKQLAGDLGVEAKPDDAKKGDAKDAKKDGAKKDQPKEDK